MKLVGWFLVSIGLVACSGPIWSAVLAHQPGVLAVSLLDVGQGDAILVRSPTGITLLIDGGPDNSIVRKLPEEIGVFEQTLDVVVESHPDKDHIAGFAEVLEKYDVNFFLSPGIPGKTAVAMDVRDAVQAEPSLHRFIARRGMRLHLGGGAYADVLYPDRDQSRQSDTNAGSTVLRVVYGDTSFMLTGDLPSAIEEYLVSLDGERLKSDVLKAGHHGSKTSTSAGWLRAVHPSLVAISAGEGNSYKHPNEEVLERIEKEGARTVSTIERGTIRFISDGRAISLQTQR